MTFPQVCSLLVREPFNCSFDQIARMTDEQIEEILFAERDDSGKLVVEEESQDDDDDEAWKNWKPKKDAPGPFRLMTYRVWRQREPGITEEQLAAKFKEKYPGYRDGAAKTADKHRPTGSAERDLPAGESVEGSQAR